ncbi:tyrosine-type recombinase/integrase [Streptomyces sp. NPDC127106]|uniref:tyrosine-type recombinase/integrase n=1 Tax=Streptomyces sp. NPDC127106 TaxID=3345360 RepID=UPI0036343C35
MVLDRLHQLSEEAGVPRITVHDLRHLAATITISAGVPLTVVSKTLQHSTLSTTANIYSHLTGRQPAKPSTPSTAPSPEPRTPAAKHAARQGCDHHATTCSSCAEPSADSAPPRRRPSVPRPTSLRLDMRPHCDHHGPGRTKGRPLMDKRTASDLLKSMVGTTGFEPATP